MGESNRQAPAWRKLKIGHVVSSAACAAVVLGAELCAARVLAQAAHAQDAQAVASARQMMNESDCFLCHRVNQKAVGPAFAAVAERYAGQPDGVAKLAAKIKNGGTGNWGDVPMPPHPDLSDAQLKAIAQWVLAQKPPAASSPEGTGAQTK